MTVKDLIELLQKEPSEYVVVYEDDTRVFPVEKVTNDDIAERVWLE